MFIFQPQFAHSQLYKIECEYNNLNKELNSKIKIESKRVMKL